MSVAVVDEVGYGRLAEETRHPPLRRRFSSVGLDLDRIGEVSVALVTPRPSATST